MFRFFEKKRQPVEFIVAGLGNPGEKYAATRHNAGFMCVDFICDSLSVKPKKYQFKALTCRADIDGHGVLIIKPQTFMNLSGEAVSEAASFYKLPPEKVVVICDDVSFDAGGMRVRPSGSDGGHNGLKSIAEHLKSENYPRIKLGVGKKPEQYDLADWVLSTLPKADREALSGRFFDAYEALKRIIAGDMQAAQALNRKQ